MYQPSKPNLNKNYIIIGVSIVVLIILIVIFIFFNSTTTPSNTKNTPNNNSLLKKHPPSNQPLEIEKNQDEPKSIPSKTKTKRRPKLKEIIILNEKIIQQCDFILEFIEKIQHFISQNQFFVTSVPEGFENELVFFAPDINPEIDKLLQDLYSKENDFVANIKEFDGTASEKTALHSLEKKLHNQSCMIQPINYLSFNTLKEQNKHTDEIKKDYSSWQKKVKKIKQNTLAILESLRTEDAGDQIKQSTLNKPNEEQKK